MNGWRGWINKGNVWPRLRPNYGLLADKQKQCMISNSQGRQVVLNGIHSNGYEYL